MSEICLSVLSWNLHAMAWPLSKDPAGRMDRVSAKMRELSPDVALFQEVWIGSAVDRLTLALQPDWIPICIKRRSFGPKGGLLTFVRAAAGWRVRTAPEFHPFAASAPAWRVWEGDGLGGKGVLTVELERGEQRVCAVNTHLQAKYRGIDYAEVRQAQLIELREVVSHSRPSLPAIVAGDLNTDSREPLYSLVAGLGADLTAEAREQDNRGTTTDPLDGRPEWIDYIVAANSHAWTVLANLELIANQRADVPYSDHSGLFCSLSLARQQ
jgi:endonuclease/exonuclease/phosphatase family metal-dependent hydrolase